MKCIEAKQDAGLTELFDVLAHLQHQLPIEKGAFFIWLSACFDRGS